MFNMTPPVIDSYSKMSSPTEILRSQHVLNAERERLMQAQRLVDLASETSARSTLVVEARRKLELVKLSPARLRWIKVINTVLVQNYVGRVKVRLLRSNYAAWYKACVVHGGREQRVASKGNAMLSLAGKPLAPGLRVATTKDRDRNARRSLDNPKLPMREGSAKSPRLSLSSPHLSPRLLPALDIPTILEDSTGMERRRQTRVQRESKPGMLGNTPKASSFRDQRESKPGLLGSTPKASSFMGERTLGKTSSTPKASALWAAREAKLGMLSSGYSPVVTVKTMLEDHMPPYLDKASLLSGEDKLGRLGSTPKASSFNGESKLDQLGELGSTPKASSYHGCGTPKAVSFSGCGTPCSTPKMGATPKASSFRFALSQLPEGVSAPEAGSYDEWLASAAYKSSRSISKPFY